MIEKPEHRNLREWIRKTFSLQGIELTKIETALQHAINRHGFHIRSTSHSETSVIVQAYYGSKIVALVAGFLPYGNHLPFGKRFFLRATAVSNAETTDVQIRIAPHMELLDSEELPLITQSPGEKLSDEYIAAIKSHNITKDVYSLLGIEIPVDWQTFDHKRAIADHAWGSLLYPIDNYDAPKTVHRPVEKGPRWSWGSCLVPEMWFIYYDAIGIAILSFVLNVLSLALIVTSTVGWGLFGLIIGLVPFLLIRIWLGTAGHRVYYARHGQWKE